MNHWQFIHSKITTGKTVFLLTVIQHKGSSPGRQGFKMVVASDAIYGSIGGGVMEYNLVEHCKELLKQGTTKSFIKHQIHKGKIVDGSGMICSGEQTVIFYPLDKSNQAFIETILNTLKENKNGLLSIQPSSIDFYPNKQQETKFFYTHSNEADWSYSEHLNQKDCLYIVGGGHVGLATTQLFNSLGFYTVVFDNRSQLNTFESNNYADQKHIIEYTEVSQYIPESSSTYVAIMTNKYTDDKIVLNQLISKKYRFIGVLGSVAKLALMFDVLKKEGVTTTQLAKVHAPIGIKIHSQTPEEIAVSIAAQIIAIKNKK